MKELTEKSKSFAKLLEQLNTQLGEKNLSVFITFNQTTNAPIYQPFNGVSAANGKGSGGVIQSNPAANPIDPATWKHDPQVIFVILAHEMQHALDAANGTTNSKPSKNYPGFPNEAEFKAVEFENKVRDDLGMKNRTKY